MDKIIQQSGLHREVKEEMETLLITFFSGDYKLEIESGIILGLSDSEL